MKQIDLGTISMGNNSYDVHSGGNAQAPSHNHPSAEAAACCNRPEYPEEVNRNDFYFSPCEDEKVCDMNEMELIGQGRILDLTMRLKHVCPGKRVAVGVVLTEVDSNNNEYPRGQKVFTVPAHHHSCCRDIPISSMRFVMPEDISVGGSDDVCCNTRHFICRVAAHYIDTTSNHCGCNEAAEQNS